MNPLIAGLLVNMGGSLLSGLFAKRAADKQREWAAAQAAKPPPGMDFQKLRDDAQKAGFNPLTALTLTGGSGYQRPIDTSGPSLGGAQFIVDGLTGAAESYFNARASQDAEALRLKHDSDMQAQLLAARGISTYSGFGVNGPTLASGKVDHSLPTIGVVSDQGGMSLSPTFLKKSEEMKTVPMYINVFDGLTGQKFSYLNPDLTDSGPAEMATGLATLAGAEATGAAKQAALRLYTHPAPGMDTGVAPEFSSTFHASGWNAGEPGYVKKPGHGTTRIYVDR